MSLNAYWLPVVRIGFDIYYFITRILYKSIHWIFTELKLIFPQNIFDLLSVKISKLQDE